MAPRNRGLRGIRLLSMTSIIAFTGRNSTRLLAGKVDWPPMYRSDSSREDYSTIVKISRYPESTSAQIFA